MCCKVLCSKTFYQKIVVILLLLSTGVLYSQVRFNQSNPITLGGNSKEKAEISKKVKKIDKIKKKSLEGLDFDALKTEIKDIKKEDPDFSMIAKGINKQIDILKEGEWEVNEDGSRICRLKIHVENSLSLILAFEKFYLPEGSELYIFDPEGEMVMGPLTKMNNKESGKFMTGLLPGPDLIVEYYENVNTINKAEIVLYDIGVGVNIDCIIDFQNKDNKKDKTQLKMPPIPYNIFDSDYSENGTYLGKPINCEDNTAINKIKRSVCQFITLQPRKDNGRQVAQFVAKTAVSVGSMNSSDCSVYLLTAGHVIWETDSTLNTDFSVVRYNWLRRKPNNDSCKYPITYDSTQWKSTIELDSVVDYCGTELLVWHNDSWADIALLRLSSRPIHNIYLAGWNANCAFDSPSAHIISNNETMKYSTCSSNAYDFDKCSSLYIGFEQSINLLVYGGVSGSPILELSNNRYRTIGIVKGGGLSIGTYYKLASCYNLNNNNQLIDYLNPDSLPTPICEGREYDPIICGTSRCCEHYVAEIQGNDPETEKDGAWRAKTSNDSCCAYITIEERLQDNIQCHSYLIDIFENDSLIHNNLTVDFNIYQDTLLQLQHCIVLNPNELWRKNKYRIVFKDLDSNIIDSCEKELVFQCSRYCNADTNSYSITFRPQENNYLEDTCCYEAIIIRNDDSDCDVNAIFPYIFDYGYTDSFAYVVDSTLFQESDTCIIRDICLKTGEFDSIYFDFYQDVDFSQDSTPIDYWYNQRIYSSQRLQIPDYCSNCCDSYQIVEHLNPINCEVWYEITNLNPIRCTRDSVQLDAYFYKDGEYILIENITKVAGDIIQIPNWKVIQGKLNSFYQYKVYYRFTFFNSAGKVICYKEITAPRCATTGTISGENSKDDCCKQITINNIPNEDWSGYTTKARIMRMEFEPISGSYQLKQYPDDTTFSYGNWFANICTNDKNTTFIIEFIDTLTGQIVARVPILLSCSCCEEDVLDFNVIGPDSNCCYSFQLVDNIGTEDCSQIKSFSVTQVGNSIPALSGSIDELSNFNVCNSGYDKLTYYFEFYTDSIISEESKKKCTKVIELGTCHNCCDEQSLVFDKIGPDTNCCYSFFFAQLDNPLGCDTIKYFSVKLENESIPIHTEAIINPFFPNLGINNYKLCNSELNSFKYLFEFYSDNTCSETSKVCSRLIELQPCIDTATACCQRAHFNIELEKGGVPCGENECNVTQTWDVPENLDCFNSYQYNQQSGPFDTLIPPLLNIGPCIPVGSSIIDSVALLRFPNDPEPCWVKFEAYCTVGDVSRGCEPDECDTTWEYKSLIRQIDSGDCAGCMLTIYYKHRNTCGSWQDLQILYIEKETDNYLIDPCACSREEIYNQALKLVVQRNDMGFEPTLDDVQSHRDSCSIQWRISQVSCWTDWEYDPDMQIVGKGKNPNPQDGDPNPTYRRITVYEPCNETCCARQVKVCRNLQDKVEITNYAIISDNNNCDTVTWRNLDCYFTCDFFDSFQNQMIPTKDEETTLEILDDNMLNLQNDSLKIYYDNTIFKVMFNKRIESYNISIFNLFGNLVASNENIISIRENTIEIDISRLPSGIYIFNISNRAESMSSGKINIIR